MAALEDPLNVLRKLNGIAPFNRWCGMEVTEAETGRVVITMPWRPELGQFVGYLHPGLLGALIDTACGFAAATQFGQNLIASQYSVNCLTASTGEIFIAQARVLKATGSQVFTWCDVTARTGSVDTPIATGETVLAIIQPSTPA